MSPTESVIEGVLPTVISTDRCPRTGRGILPVPGKRKLNTSSFNNEANTNTYFKFINLSCYFSFEANAKL